LGWLRWAEKAADADFLREMIAPPSGRWNWLFCPAD
jgi:hypothetical protein